MRRIALLMTGSALVAWGVGGAIGGCGNDDPAVGNTPDSSTGTSSGSSGNTSSGTSGTSSGDIPDAGNTSSGVISNPGKIACATVECDAGDPAGPGGDTVCCVREAGASRVCGLENDCDQQGAFQMRCDENADCIDLDNPQCCFDNQGSYCDNNCDGPGLGAQLCKTDGECGDAGACAEKLCGANDEGMGGRRLRVCGTPEGCTP